MDNIRKMAKEMREELSDAERYAWRAAQVKEQDPALFSMYYRLSGEELGHMELLRAAASEHVNACIRSGHADAEKVAACWAWEQDFASEKAAEVRALLATIK